MPELQEDEGALGVDGINDLAPASTCWSDQMPGTPGLPKAVVVTGEASAMISPPSVARCA